MSEPIYPPNYLNLSENIYPLASWRNIPPRKRPTMGQFSWSTANDRLQRTINKNQNIYAWKWDQASINERCSQEEAAFWLNIWLMAASGGNTRNKLIPYAQTEPAELLTITDPEQTLAQMSQYRRWLSHHLFWAASKIFSTSQLTSFICDNYQGMIYHLSWLNYFREQILPYLNREEKEAAQTVVRSALTTVTLPTTLKYNTFYYTPAPYHLAAYLGMHDDLYPLILNWPDTYFGNNPFKPQKITPLRPQEIIFGLADPALIVEQFNRFNLPLRSKHQAAMWLLHTETNELHLISKSILSISKKSEAKGMLDQLSNVKDPLITNEMLKIRQEAVPVHLVNRAQDWLNQSPELAVSFIATTMADNDPLRNTADNYLRDLLGAGHETLLKTHLSEERYASLTHRQKLPEFTAENTPPWLQAAMPDKLEESLPHWPDWLRPEILPSLSCGQFELNNTQKKAVLLHLYHHIRPNAFIEELRTQIPAEERNHFAWFLLEQSRHHGIQSIHYWLMRGIAQLGQESLILRFVQLVKLWAKERRQSLVRSGLIVLGEWGIWEDTALLQLYQMQRTLNRKQYRDWATDHVADIATERQLSRIALGDQLVPDCGLDEEGHISFDYGPRLFHFQPGNDLFPRLIDETGRAIKNLPQPRKSDDPAKVQIARDQWKLLKKEWQDTFKIQRIRAEEAMVLERRWSWNRFQSLFLDHPFMQIFSRHLLWGLYETNGRFVTAFRITEDHRFADAADEPIDLASLIIPQPTDSPPTPPANKSTLQRIWQQLAGKQTAKKRRQPLQLLRQIGIVHPLHLKPEQRKEWQTLFHDYEIISPFPQTERPLFMLRNAEASGGPIQKWAGTSFHILQMQKLMRERHWYPDSSRRDGASYRRYFPNDKLYGVVFTKKVNDTTYRLGHAAFASSNLPNALYTATKSLKQITPFNEINPIATSELIYDLQSIANRGK